MRTSIILVISDLTDNFTSPSALPVTIRALDILRGEHELVIVNNAETRLCPNTSDYIRQLAAQLPRVKVLELDHNYGCGGGFNRGAAVADDKTDILVYMSTDALIVDQYMLEKIQHVFGRYHRVAMVHPISVFEDSEDLNYSKSWSSTAFRRVLAGYDLEKDGYPKDPLLEIEAILKEMQRRRISVTYPVSALPLTFLAMRRRVFLESGGFNEDFFAGYENIDLILRMLRSGWYSARLNNSFVFHRRLLFRLLGSWGKNEELLKTAVNRGHITWNRLYGGKAPMDVYYEFRFGAFASRAIISPVRSIRRATKRLLSIG